ncbi:MAG: hypothetical protein Q4C11_00255 [Clostridium sp.]|nr:hypothetical protein [Clostridium sp.]
MKKYQIGNVVETKDGDKCIVVDIKDKEAVVFSLSIMEPETIKLSEIKEKIADANYTTVIVNGKKTVRKQDEEEFKEEKDETIEIEENEESSKECNDPAEMFGELVKLFGKAAIEIGNIITKVAESDDEDDNKR